MDAVAWVVFLRDLALAVEHGRVEVAQLEGKSLVEIQTEVGEDIRRFNEKNAAGRAEGHEGDGE